MDVVWKLAEFVGAVAFVTLAFFAARVIARWVAAVRYAYHASRALLVDSEADRQLEELERQDEERFDGHQHGDGGEPCVCGSTDHTSTHVTWVVTPALLDNATHGRMPITACFAFAEADPFAIQMTLSLQVDVQGFYIGDDTETWTYARDILDTALSTDGQSGAGDVVAQFHVDTGLIDIWLKDPQGGVHLVEVNAEPVKTLLVNSFALVPQGEEKPDVDTAIDKLLDGTWDQ